MQPDLAQALGLEICACCGKAKRPKNSDSRQLRQVLAGVQAGCVVGSPPFVDNIASSARVGHASTYTGHRLDDFGHTEGQLGALPPGTPPACVVGSPPFVDCLAQTDPSFLAPHQRADHGRNETAATVHAKEYGSSPGQLGALPPGTPPDAVLSSPPYAGAGQVLGTHNGIDWSKVQGSGKAATPARIASGEGYGRSAGQLGAMPAGAVVSSPPYAESLHLNESVEADIARLTRKGVPMTGGATSRVPLPNQQANQGYGTSTGQLGAMPAGAIISSPPYAESNQNYTDAWGYVDPGQRNPSRRGHNLQADYGGTPGNLGTEATTFWEAASAIMAEVAALLPVGAVACWVVKGYVSKGRLVDFPAQWQALCESHGFRLVEEIHASLVEDHGTQEGLFGAAETLTTERKSFFRRLHERKPGAVRIDHETVLIMRKEAL